MGADNTVYVGTRDKALYALNANGTEQWRFEVGDWAHAPTVDPSNGAIYFGSDDNRIYAVYPNGTEKWSFTTGDNVESSPAVGPDGTIYAGSVDGNVYALDAASGAQIFTFISDDNFFHSAPVITDSNVVFAGGSSKQLFAFKAPASCTFLGAAGDPISFATSTTMTSFKAATFACGDLWKAAVCDSEYMTGGFCAAYAGNSNPPFNCHVKKKRAFLEAISLSIGLSGNLFSVLLLSISFYLARMARCRRVQPNPKTPRDSVVHTVKGLGQSDV